MLSATIPGDTRDGVDARPELLALLARARNDPEALAAGVLSLARDEGPETFVGLLFLLAHLRFSPAEAERHWQRVLAAQAELSAHLERPVDVRVALVSYFLEESHQLENPMIIELHLLRATEASAYRDALTGLYNYRYFQEHIEHEVSRAARYGSRLSLVMLDVDDFKAYNDRNGHPAGNAALSTLAELVRETVRDCDVAVRYGGEELALLLPSTAREGARRVAERLRGRVGAQRFPGGDGREATTVTASLGVATYPDDAGSAAELVAAADRALYQAKRQGKNRVC